MTDVVKQETKKEVNAWDKYVKQGLKEVVYWSKAKKLRIGNFKQEQRFPDGRILSREMPLKFDEHVHICDVNKPKGQEEIAFIENSDTFKNGDCRYAKSHAEAKAFTYQQGAIKSVTKLTVKSEESVLLEEKGGQFVPVVGSEMSVDTIK